MSETRLSPLSGVLFALLVLVGFGIDPNTEFMPPASEVVARLGEGPVRVMTAAYTTLLASAALLWFSGSMSRSLRRLDDDGGRLSAIATAGAVLAASALALGATSTIAAAERVWVHGAIEPGVAAALLDVSAIAVGNATPVGLAVMIAASGVVLLRSEERSAAVGWGSILLATGLISPFGWVAMLLGVLWVPAAGISIFRKERDESLVAAS